MMQLNIDGFINGYTQGSILGDAFIHPPKIWHFTLVFLLPRLVNKLSLRLGDETT